MQPKPTWQGALFEGIGPRSVAQQGELFPNHVEPARRVAPVPDAPGQLTFDAEEGSGVCFPDE